MNIQIWTNSLLNHSDVTFTEQIQTNLHSSRGTFYTSQGTKCDFICIVTNDTEFYDVYVQSNKYIRVITYGHFCDPNCKSTVAIGNVDIKSTFIKTPTKREIDEFNDAFIKFCNGDESHMDTSQIKKQAIRDTILNINDESYSEVCFGLF